MQICGLSTGEPWRREAVYLRTNLQIELYREYVPCAVPAQLLAANRKLPIASCDWELSNYVTTMTAKKRSGAFRSCDSQSQWSHDHKPRPASRHLKPL